MLALILIAPLHRIGKLTHEPWNELQERHPPCKRELVNIVNFDISELGHPQHAVKRSQCVRADVSWVIEEIHSLSVPVWGHDYCRAAWF